ncbi:hypothetical protein BGZ65_000984, partial [Modicella reniformis]
HIREFSTGINNMWSRSINDKSLEYLLRILLRLHLPHSVSSGQGNLFKKQPQKGESAANLQQ